MSNTEELGRRAEQWADARATRVQGRNPWALAVRTVRSSAEDRVTGLAAEMAFFALLSLVPAIVAVGAGLGWLERLIGAEDVARGRDAVLTTLATVFSPQVTEEVLQPLVQGLLEEQRGGVALSSIVIALWLASRVFTATIRALDQAYNVEERRNLVQQRLLALLFAVGAVVLVPLVLILAVVGPLLGTGGDVADRLGLGEMFAAFWAAARWPLLLLAAITAFASVYRFGPHVENRWRDCLPGAIVGVLLWLLASVGFRIYLATAGDPTARFAAGEEAAAALSAVGGIVAAILWTFLSSVALLVGGELNAEIDATAAGRRRRPRRSAPTDAPRRTDERRRTKDRRRASDRRHDGDRRDEPGAADAGRPGGRSAAAPPPPTRRDIRQPPAGPAGR